jgi:hypothetical protein
VARTPRIAALFLMAATFSLFARPFAELVPAFAGQVFNGGPKALSMLLSAQGAGALAGALWMLRQRAAEKLPFLVYAMGFGLCVTLLAFTSTRDLGLAAFVMAAAGLFHVICNISMQSLAQLEADDAYKGRVMGLYGLLFRCLPATGAFAIGVGAHWAPLQVLVAAGAAVAAVIIVVLAWDARRIYARPPQE